MPIKLFQFDSRILNPDASLLPIVDFPQAISRLSHMPTKKKYSQAARVQGILRTLGARQGITVGELAEELGVTRIIMNLKTFK
jgi:hypothetical protein